VDQGGLEKQCHESGGDLILQVDIDSETNIADAEIGIVIQSIHGARIISSLTTESGFSAFLGVGRHSFQCRFANVRLRPGRSVSLLLWLAEHYKEIDCVQDALLIDVVHGRETQSRLADAAQGIVLCDYEWKKL
jgi:hypothetical protein